jgi:ribosomal protein S18 acetylase RimI-like enzyme
MIRPFEPDDRDELERLQNAFGDEIASMDPLSRVIRTEGYGRFYVAKMLDEAANGMGIVLISEEGAHGRIGGYGAGIIRERSDDDVYQVIPFHDGEVTELYVVPEARSRGIGTQLVRAFEAWFREKNCGAVHIEVFAPNEGAMRFYRRLGYEPRDIHQIKNLESFPGTTA